MDRIESTTTISTTIESDDKNVHEEVEEVGDQPNDDDDNNRNDENQDNKDLGVEARKDEPSTSHQPTVAKKVRKPRDSGIKAEK